MDRKQKQRAMMSVVCIQTGSVTPDIKATSCVGEVCIIGLQVGHEYYCRAVITQQRLYVHVHTLRPTACRPTVKNNCSTVTRYCQQNSRNCRFLPNPFAFKGVRGLIVGGGNEARTRALVHGRK